MLKGGEGRVIAADKKLLATKYL